MSVNMSGQINHHSNETLFSFEVLVDRVQIQNEHVSDELAIALRLLDFPTLIIYQPKSVGEASRRLHERVGNGKEQGEQAGEPSWRRKHEFHKGKSCLFKMCVDTLHAQLSNTPLYAMLLDVKDEIPKLVGTSLISLAQLVDRIRLDVNSRGISTPSSHGEKGHVGIIDLMGDTIGLMSVKFKLLSLGTSLLPHILEKRTHVISSIHEQEHVEMEVERNTCLKQPLHCGQIKSSLLRGQHLYSDGPSNQRCDVPREPSACVATQTEPTPLRRPGSYEEDQNVFCPPILFYSSSGEATPTRHCVDEVEGVEPFTLEAPEPRTPERSSVVKHSVNTQTQEDPNEPTLNLPGEMLTQLPLLNALLVELSQLTRQSIQPPLSVHPNLAWIYNSAVADPLVGDSTAPTAPTKTPIIPRQTGPRLRGCCTPQTMTASQKQNSTKVSTAGKTLKYGTTKTFQLRLKQIPPGQAKRRQCMEMESLSLTRKSNSDNKSHTGPIKPDRGKKAVNQTARAEENVEAVIHSSAGDSAARGTSRLHMNQDTSTHAHQTSKVEIAGNGPQKLSLHEESNRERVPGAGVADENEVGRNRGARRGESPRTRPLPDRKGQEETGRSGCSSGSSSALWSPRSSHRSASSSTRGGGGGCEEEQYMDDFNSLDPSEGRSMDPPSSPERGLASSLGAGSSPLRRVPPLPVPVGALGSPQRSLRGTHIIRPRNQVSALSVSSDSDDERSAGSSRKAVRTGTQRPGGADRCFVTESLRSSGGRRSDSAQNGSHAGGLSVDSASSYDSCEVEELRDELGSLDLKRNYQHISKLVANKLPGYTL